MRRSSLKNMDRLENQSRNSDWNRTNEHFNMGNSERSRFDRSDRDRGDRYDRSDRTERSDRENSFGDTSFARDDFRDSGRESGHWNRSGMNSSDYGLDDYRSRDRNFGSQDSYRDSEFSRESNRNRDMDRSSVNNMLSNSYGNNEPRSSRPAQSNNYRTGHYGKGPKGWKLSDEKLKDEVCEALYRDQHIDATHIDVAVSEGIVTLSGTIDTRVAKRHAEDCVEHLMGVEDVRNEIKVNRATDESVNNLSGRRDSVRSSTLDGKSLS